MRTIFALTLYSDGAYRRFYITGPPYAVDCEMYVCGVLCECMAPFCTSLRLEAEPFARVLSHYIGFSGPWR